MSKVTVQFLGTGDAFGSGGRFQSCIRIELSNQSYMLDFGASSLIAMKRCNVDPSHVYAILLTHLHGDHFGGIPFFLIQEQLVSKRTSPILIAGPPGLEERINLAMEVFFPGSSKMQWKFPIEFFQISGPHPNWQTDRHSISSGPCQWFALICFPNRMRGKGPQLFGRQRMD